MTRLTQRPALLGPGRTLLCPADPAIRPARSSKGQTNQAWGNVANASQEPGSEGNLKDPEAGSWQAEIADKQETVRFSYLHPLGWAKSVWPKLSAQGNQSGIAVCQLHGVRTAMDHNSIDHRPFADSEGRTFPAQRDGAVVTRKIFRSALPQPTTAPPKAMDYPWDFYTDNPPPSP
jgi:hypothetical protein